MIGQRASKQTERQKRDAYAAVTERDGGRCQRCGRAGPVERDHRQGRDAYNTVPSNLQCLCRDCHAFKTHFPEWAMRDGFSVSRWADPATTPAYRYGVGWVIYHDEPDNNGNWWHTVTAPD